MEFAIGLLIVLVGLLLQFVAGPFRFVWIEPPVNVIVFWLYILVVWSVSIRFKESRAVRWLGSIRSAVGSIAWTLALTLVLGLVRQQPVPFRTFPGFSDMLSNWSFLLVFLWLLTSMACAVSRVCRPLTLKKVPFLLYHLGLFLALLCGFMGKAEVRRCSMTLSVGESSCHAVSQDGSDSLLPFSIELTGFQMPYFENCETDTQIPRQFISNVRIDDGLSSKDCRISVNHPAKSGNWHIYQYGYEGDNTSVFRIIYDPWRYKVLLGILIMFAGAICLFVQISKRKRTE